MDYKIAIVGSFVSCYPPAVSTAGSLFPIILQHSIHGFNRPTAGITYFFPAKPVSPYFISLAPVVPSRSSSCHLLTKTRGFIFPATLRLCQRRKRTGLNWNDPGKKAVPALITIYLFILSPFTQLCKIMVQKCTKCTFIDK